MALIDKVSQKFSHLKSKKTILDFFIIFKEVQTVNININNLQVSSELFPVLYNEYSIGKYTIVWPNQYYSKGYLTFGDIEEIENFIKHAQSNSKKYQSIFIPHKIIYPIVRTNSKSTADCIDNPEYLLKIADLVYELGKSINFEAILSNIKVARGINYAFNSDNSDLNYLYSKFIFENIIPGYFIWPYTSVEAPSISKVNDILSFIADLFNLIKKEKKKKLDIKSNVDIILIPSLFEKIFNQFLISHLVSDRIKNKKSIFKIEEFHQKKRVLGLLSIGYDPLVNMKLGTYSFTDYGLVANKFYFIKLGKLESPILDEVDYTTLGYNQPTIEIKDFENIKIEGLYKSKFYDFKNFYNRPTILVPSIKLIKTVKNEKNDSMEIIIIGENCLLLEHSYQKTLSIGQIVFKINLIQKLANREIELIEFIDNKIGAKIINTSIKLI